MKPLLGCSMGDPAGIGPEVLLRAASQVRGDGQAAGCLFLGDATVFATYAGALPGIEPPTIVESAEQARASLANGQPGPFLLECARVPSGFTPGTPRREDSAAALAAVMSGAQFAAAGDVDALVTAPLSKHGVAARVPGFKGHTEFLAALDGASHPIMLFAGPRDTEITTPDIALLTTHLPLVTAIAAVQPAAVESAIVRLHGAWAAQFGREPVIGIAALNPHAGEFGAIGGEEARVLAPAIRAAAAEGIDVRGPFPADSCFLRQELDVILALYHDQGTIMAKRAPWPTVNLTLGLSYIRTSPDHGTAYDLAGSGRADHAPTLAAMNLASRLAGRLGNGYETAGNDATDVA